MSERKAAFAVAAHPDDIEFMMSGTLALLGRAGYELHYMNLANGCCGSATLSRDQIAPRRAREAAEAAALVGAAWHPPIVNDMEVFFSNDALLRLAAVMREVSPSILLVPSPDDYMEDHTNASRLAVTAAFARAMPNLPAIPPTSAVGTDVTIYHALPYGLRDGMRRRIFAGEYVDVSSVMDLKTRMLAAHASQKEWIDRSQGLDEYLHVMREMCEKAGRMSGVFQYAEGWRRHSHLGFSAEDRDVLAEALGALVKVDEEYENGLDRRVR